MKQVNIFLIGAYGYNNIGDDIFFYVLEKIFEKKYVKFFLRIVSANTSYKYTSNHPILYVTPKNLFKIIYGIFQSDIVIIGPGSVFTSVSFFWKQNVYIFIVSLFSRILGKKLIFLGVDFVTPPNVFLKYLALCSLRMSTKIYIRFPSNFENLLQYVYLKSKLSLISDVVYSKYFLDFAHIDFGSNVLQKNSSQKKIALVFSDFSFFNNSQEYCNFIVDILNYFSQKNYTLHILSLNMGISNNKDMDFYETLKPYLLSDIEQVQFNIWNNHTVSEVIKFLQDSDLFVSTKLHASILASITSTPFLSLSYHDKMRELNSFIELDQKYDFDIEKISSFSRGEYIERFEKQSEFLLKTGGVNYNLEKVEKIIEQNQHFLENLDF